MTVTKKCRHGLGRGSVAVALLVAGMCLLPVMGWADSGGKDGDPENENNTSYTGTVDGSSTGNYAQSNGHVIIDTDHANLSVYGGYGKNTDNATKNSVTFKGGTALNVYGGYSQSGDAIGNSVIFEGGDALPGSVYGGNTGSGGNARSNSVSFTGGSAINVSGGGNDEGVAFAQDNSVTISGGTVNSVFGGQSQKDARDNKVTISDEATVKYHVYGGFSSAGTAAKNSVTISGGTVGTGDPGNAVYGGRAENGSAATATSNTVSISGGIVNGSVYGGHSQSSSASNNRVEISGGTVSKSNIENAELVAVYGGYTGFAGAATGNTVVISGGTLQDIEIFGAKADSTATDNTIVLSGAPNLTGSTLYGASAGKTMSNNTLEVRSIGLSAANVADFQNYQFILPSTVKAGDVVLTLTGTAKTDISDSAVGVTVAGGATPLKVGDSITLLKNDNGLISTGYPQKFIAGTQGISLEYYFLLAATDIALTVTSSVGVNPQTKSLSEGRLSGMALLNMGGDLISGAAMDSLRALPASDGWGTFGAVSGGASRHETGSHINVSGVSALFGLGRSFAGEAAAVKAGAFFETGSGKYSTHNSFENAASVRGDGDGRYYGAGLMARVDMTATPLSGLYTEGSFRMGHLDNDWHSDDMRDASGRRAAYDTGATYYGAHLGLGYLLPLTERDTLDVYGKYLWTRQEGDDVSVVDDPYHFDAVDSRRLRLGARLNHTFTEQVSAYAGAAWEHEFDGKARATVYEMDVPAPSLRGDTGRFELGLSFTPAANSALSFDLGAQGYAGTRQGVSGSAQVVYRF